MAKTYLATRDDVNAKTAKHLLSLVGNNIYEGDKQLTFTEVRSMLLDTPDFVVLVYNDKAYHPNTTSTSSVVFSSTTVSNGNVKVDRITMATNGTVTMTSGEAEKTSGRTDDIANNADDSNKYPSTKGVADYVHSEIDNIDLSGYLPLAGGTENTMQGAIYFGNNCGAINGFEQNHYMALYAYASPMDNSNRMRFTMKAGDENVANWLYLTKTDSSGDHNYSIFGNHNFVIDATGDTHDMDVYFKQGVHFKWYRTNGNTLNTPTKAGITSGYNYSVIMSYTISANAGLQVAFPSGHDTIYIRHMNNGVITAWKKVGGGVKSVQRGTISLNGDTTTNNAKISSVDTSKAVVLYTGHLFQASNSYGMATNDVTLSLTDSTTVTAKKATVINSSETVTVPYQVIEYN